MLQFEISVCSVEATSINDIFRESNRLYVDEAMSADTSPRLTMFFAGKFE